MIANAFLIYVLLLCIYLLLFIGIRSWYYSNEAISGIHYGLLSSIALQGLASMIFGLAGISLSLERLNFATLVPIVAMTVWWGMHRRGTKIIAPTLSVSTMVLSSHLLSFLFALAAGLLFFTVDLIPSSMSGDPARHFMAIFDPTELRQAMIYKPIYYQWAGVFIHSFPFFQKDQLFILFNIFALGLSTSSCLLLFTNLFPAARILPIFTAALLVCFGYPLFILHYGGYTLLLSSAFLFSAMALLLEYKDVKNRKLYVVVTLLVIGVVLTHSYLALDALLALVGFAYWNARRQDKDVASEITQHMPFWLLIVLVAIASNQGLITGSPIDSFANIIVTRGFVNGSVFLNLLPFLPFAGIYFFLHRESEQAQALLVFIVATTTFSLGMGALYWMGAAPYYLNRNQIILLPLLILATVALIQTLEQRHAEFSKLLYIATALAVIAPYIFIQNSPLSISHTKFRELLVDEQLVYLENAINTSFSPLQMTDRDRALMREIGMKKSNCLDGIPDKVAALDVDQEVMWFYFYTNIYPSLLQKSDGFMDFKNHLRNYEEWKSNPSHSNIVVFRNFDFWQQGYILNDIRSRASLICKGDSIEIYRKFGS